MIIGVPKETKLQEHRIGLTPDSVKILHERGHKVLVESNGGFEAGFTDQDYQKAGASVYMSASDIFKDAEINSMDGLKLIWDNCWIHIRSSNTEPIMRIYAEAETKKAAEKLVEQVKACL